MARTIVFIQGGPRRDGNTRAMAAVAMRAAAEAGAAVAEVDALKLSFSVPGCLGCDACQRSDTYGCTLGDEVARVVATVPSYDAIVLATPLYWYSYSAQLKIVVDRFYSLNKYEPGSLGTAARSLLSGKVFGLLATAAGPIEHNLDILEAQWRQPARSRGCAFISCLFPGAPGEGGALLRDPIAVARAQEFGRRLAAST